ncbi:MAG: dihydrodipicolinate synthase family protein [Acidimicrobiales bacterium]
MSTTRRTPGGGAACPRPAAPARRGAGGSDGAEGDRGADLLRRRGRSADDQRAILVGAVRAALPQHVMVLAGAGAPSAAQAVHLTKVVLDAGAEAVLALSLPRSSDAPRYCEPVAGAASGAAVLACHFPAAS